MSYFHPYEYSENTFALMGSLLDENDFFTTRNSHGQYLGMKTREHSRDPSLFYYSNRKIDHMMLHSDEFEMIERYHYEQLSRKQEADHPWPFGRQEQGSKDSHDSYYVWGWLF